jgi:hypothetical protein
MYRFMVGHNRSHPLAMSDSAFPPLRTEGGGCYGLDYDKCKGFEKDACIVNCGMGVGGVCLRDYDLSAVETQQYNRTGCWPVIVWDLYFGISVSGLWFMI